METLGAKGVVWDPEKVKASQLSLFSPTRSDFINNRLLPLKKTEAGNKIFLILIQFSK